MKVLLKMREEERYLVSLGVWTTDPNEARDFTSFAPLLEFQHQHQLKDVEALYFFEDQQYNFVLKLR